MGGGHFKRGAGSNPAKRLGKNRLRNEHWIIGVGDTRAIGELDKKILFRGDTKTLIRIDLRNNNSRSGQNNSWIWPFRKERNRVLAGGGI